MLILTPINQIFISSQIPIWLSHAALTPAARGCQFSRAEDLPGTLSTSLPLNIPLDQGYGQASPVITTFRRKPNSATAQLPLETARCWLVPMTALPGTPWLLPDCPMALWIRSSTTRGRSTPRCGEAVSIAAQTADQHGRKLARPLLSPISMCTSFASTRMALCTSSSRPTTLALSCKEAFTNSSADHGRNFLPD